MIKVGNQKIGDDTFETFTIREEGFFTANKKDDGYVQSEFRMLDGKSEGVGIAISVFDSMTPKGDYSPQELTKEETKAFIQFLIKSYKKM